MFLRNIIYLVGLCIIPILCDRDVEVKTEEDLGVKYANRCEVCKILATELQNRLEETGKVHDVIEIGYSLDDVQPKKKTKYQKSELRLIESLDGVCEKILEYNIHKERQDSSRFAKGMSQTFKTLHGLVDKGVKVDLGIPYELWDKPSAEITQLKTQCESLLEDNEDAIEDWYWRLQGTKDLKLHLCRDYALKHSDQSCLYDNVNLKGDSKQSNGFEDKLNLEDKVVKPSVVKEKNEVNPDAAQSQLRGETVIKPESAQPSILKTENELPESGILNEEFKVLTTEQEIEYPQKPEEEKESERKANEKFVESYEDDLFDFEDPDLDIDYAKMPRNKPKTETISSAEKRRIKKKYMAEYMLLNNKQRQYLSQIAKEEDLLYSRGDLDHIWSEPSIYDEQLTEDDENLHEPIWIEQVKDEKKRYNEESRSGREEL